MKLSKVSPVQSVTVEVDLETRRNQVNKRNTESRKETLLRKAFLPIIFSMNCFGLYFETANNGTKKRCLWRVYCGVVGIILWLNFVRMFTIFTSEDSIYTILEKCGYIAWMAMGAASHFSFYRLSASGIIEELYEKIDKETDRRIKWIGIKTIVGACACWIFSFLNTLSLGVYMFMGFRVLDSVICPLNTIIIDASKSVLHIAEYLFLVLNIYVAGSVSFPVMWNLLWASVFHDQFEACTKRLNDVVKAKPNLENSGFEALRRRHQALCRMVDDLDKFVCLTSAVLFVGVIVIIILSLYSVLSLPTSKGSDVLLVGSQLVWVIAGLISLFMWAYGGIMINNAAHKIYKRIHDIDLISLSPETIGQINVFLNRLSGEPIGFTVLRIFVIDRNTILTILGLLMTYFLLIIQMMPPSSNNSQKSSRNISNTTSFLINENFSLAPQQKF